MLIVLEGLDASGKTTQTRLLVERLKSTGKTVYTLDFPQYNNNVFGGILKRYLANEFGNSVNLYPRLSALLFAGDRLESKHMLDKWLSEPDSIVVLNRYIPSNIAYNRAKVSAKADNTPESITNFIETLEYNLLDLPRPDLVLVLGSSSVITQSRLKGSERDAYENDATFLDRVAAEYLELCGKHKHWIFVPIELDESRESVHKKLWATTQALLSIWKYGNSKSKKN